MVANVLFLVIFVICLTSFSRMTIIWPCNHSFPDFRNHPRWMCLMPGRYFLSSVPVLSLFDFEVVMAIKRLYSVFDTVATTYSLPFCEATDASAIRAFVRAAASPDSLLSGSPADFQLFHLGDFDDCAGAFFSVGARVQLPSVAPVVEDVVI